MIHPLNRSRPATIPIVLVLVALSAAGCAQSKASRAANWKHPTLPKEAWAADTGECRRYAQRETEHEAGLPAMSSGAVSGTTDNLSGGMSNFNAQMSRYELARFQDRAFASCMRRLGYQPIVGK